MYVQVVREVLQSCGLRELVHLLQSLREVGEENGAFVVHPSPTAGVRGGSMRKLDGVPATHSLILMLVVITASDWVEVACLVWEMEGDTGGVHMISAAVCDRSVT